MDTFIVTLMAVTLVALIIGLVKPSRIMFWSTNPSRWKVFGWYLLINLILIIVFTISGGGNRTLESKDKQEQTDQVDEVAKQNTDSINNDLQINIDIETQKKKEVADEIKSWGAKDAYFNEDNYFVYCVDPAEISASGDEVARAMFPNVEEVPGVRGCIVLDYFTKKEIGKYDAR